MSTFSASRLVIALALCLAGCGEQRMEVVSEPPERPLTAEELEALPQSERVLYDAIVSGKLAGAKASDYQNELNTADEYIDDRERTVVYVFRITEDDGSIDGPLFMWIGVQKKFGHIYGCEIHTASTW